MRILALLFLVLTACETPKSKSPTTAPDPLSEAQVQEWVKTAERLRDREFKTYPTLQARTTHEQLREVLPEAAAQDRMILLETLFGYPATRAHVLEVPSFSRLSGYDPGTNTLWYATGADPGVTRAHVTLATVQALNLQHFNAPVEAKTWDAWLAQRAVDAGDAVMVTAMTDLEQQKIKPELIFERPDVAQRLTSTSGWMAMDTAMKSSGTDLRERAFILREGLVFSASLARSGGWSAVEMPRFERLTQTAAIVRPDLWLRGDLESEWKHHSITVPDGFALAHTTRVGPALLAIWMTDFVDHRVVRTVYPRWQSDAFRVWKKGPDWISVWTTFWDSPDSAQQLRSVLESGFARRQDARFAVVQDGASVVITGSNTLALEELALIGQQAVKDAPVFLPQPQLADYRASAVDLYLEGLSRAQLDTEKHHWSDPATHVEMDLKEVSTWKMQKTDDATARLVVTDPKGPVLLLSTELIDPLAPEFGTDAFASRVLKAFRESVKTDDEPFWKYEDLPSLGNTLHLELRGNVGGSQQALHLWIFESANALITFSVRGEEPAFTDATAQARRLLSTVTKLDPEKSETPTDGILEFKVEE